VSLTASLSLLGCVMPVGQDWLFERMAAPAQGWHIRSEAADTWPTPGGLDLAVIQAARAVAQQGGRLAVAVPRVVTGIALGPIVYIALNGLIQSSQYASQPGFVPFPLLGDKYLAIACRSHAVRDLLGESLVKFHTQETRFCQFPTFRLTRTGTLEPGVYGRLPKHTRPKHTDMVTNGPALIVYDYWPLPAYSKIPRVGALVAELGEQDSLETLDRLSDFMQRTQPRIALAIVNMNDKEKCQRLAALDFQFSIHRCPDARSVAGVTHAILRGN
jgi:hypothetical protein